MDGSGDPDMDDISNADEERLGLNPSVSDAQFADADEDGWSKGDEDAFGTSDNNPASVPQVFGTGGQWEVRVVQSDGVEINTLAAADDLVNGVTPAAQDETTFHDFINFGDGGNGLFGGDTQWSIEADGDQNDFVAVAKGTIEVLIGGDLSFNLRTDDGGRVIINGNEVWTDDSLHGDRDGIFTVRRGPGIYTVEAMFFERGGGDNMELTGTIVSENSLNGLGGGGYELVPAVAPAEPSKLPPNLLAYWSFDEGDGDPVDAVNGVTAARINGPTYVDGVSGSAMDFGADNAGGQTLSVDPSILEPIAASDGLTISFFQKLHAVLNSSSVWATTEDSDRAFQLHTPWGNGQFYFDSAGCCDPPQRINAQVNPALDVWIHIAVTKNGSEKKVYIDGVEAFSGTDAAPIPWGFTSFFIGSAVDGMNSLPGAIDEFSIWSRDIGAAGVARLAAGGSPLTQVSSGTIAEVGDLDLEGDVLYALNIGGTPVNVGGVDFTSEDDTAGVNFFAVNHMPAWDPAIASGDAGLDEILNSMRWTEVSDDPPSVDLEVAVDPGCYQVTLIFAEKCCERGFDVFINGELVADDFSPDAIQGGPDQRGVLGSFLKVQMVVNGDQIAVELNGTDAAFPDQNSTLMGAIVEWIPDGGGVELLINGSFEEPVLDNINTNNLGTVPVGWSQTGADETWNLIRNDGSSYSSGVDNAADGAQIVDLNGVFELFQNFTLEETSDVRFGASFANREGHDGSDPSTVGIYDAPGTTLLSPVVSVDTSADPTPLRCGGPARPRPRACPPANTNSASR